MIEIIENTLRDGSYLIDFQFDQEQTSNIVSGLDELGFRYIEVGHGLGIGAWNKPAFGLAKESDRNYVRAAKNASMNARVGVFFIAGIGTTDDIDIALEEGIDFIRIGTNVDSFDKALKYATYAKKKGIQFIAINLMKSYAVKSYEFTLIAQEIDRWEVADAIYLVDSAGCMLPSEVFEYVDRTKEKVTTEIGFHGHNNLSLAVANTLEAVKAGAKYIDTCVRGMGRSAGNAQSEIVVPLLQKMGISPIDTEPYSFYDFANRLIVPLMKKPQGLNDEEIHIGISKFHTSYLPYVNEAAGKYGVDKKKLIKMVSDINCVNPDKELFFEIASQLYES